MTDSPRANQRMSGREISEWLLQSDSSHLVHLAKDHLALLDENQRLRAALKWYSCTDRNMIEQTSDEIWDTDDMLAGKIYYYGERARKALAESNGQ